MPATKRVKCHCGSGLVKRELYDARHIFVAYVCDACENRVRAHYRDEIFLDPQYETTEPIESEDY